jgi:glycosyltransferase involved in cell wall biosynthesis
VKLLFLTGSLVHGGAERHTITLANQLAARGHPCHFRYIKNDPSQLERLRGAASVECLHARRYLDWRALAKLIRCMREIKPDVVVAANPYAMFYASLALRASGVRAPLAVVYHTTVLLTAKSWLQMLYYRPFFWSADRLVFVCEAQQRHWRKRGVAARSNLVVYNGVDCEHWQPGTAQERALIRGALGLAERDFVIGMCAVFRPEKNHLQLVEALAKLRRRGIPARALLIGDGPMRPAIEARARSLGVAGDVLVTGFQQDVRPFVGACDTVALCSGVSETFSLAGLEAMALQKPVVHSAVGGAAEMVKPWQTGFIFPAGDDAALVDALATLADEPLRARMGAQARESVEARFSERAMVERYEQTLQELASHRSQHENVRRNAAAH